MTARYFSVNWPSNVDFLVRAMILLATVFVMADLVAVRLLAPDGVFYLLFFTIGPLSSWLILKTNSGMLLAIWKHELGKLAYGVFASIIVTGGKVLADQEIRDLLQSNPSLFPSAQQSIALYNILVMVLVFITIISAIAMMFQFSAFMITATLRRSFRGFINGLTTLMAYFYTYMFVTGLARISHTDE